MSEIAASAEYPPHDRGAKTVAKPSGTTEQKLLVLFQGLYHNRIIRCPYSSSNTTLVPVAPKVKDKQKMTDSAEYPPHDRGAKTVAKPSGTTEQKLLVLFQGLYHNRIIRCPYSSSNTTLVPVAPKVKDKQKMTEDRRQH